MTTETQHQAHPAPPRAGDRVLAFAGRLKTEERSSWGAIAAVYVSVPLAAIAFWWLYREHHVGSTPLWVMVIILAITSVVNLGSFLWLRTHPGPGLQMQMRLAVSAMSTTAVVYTLGWGSILIIGYAVGVAEIVRSNGSATWRGALGWNGGCILLGEIAIQLHIAPSILPIPIAHEVAFFGFCCLAVVTQVLVLTGRAAEQAEVKLRERSQQFESLVEHASDVIGVVDGSGVISFASPAVETLLGHAPSELTNTQLQDLLHPDDAAEVRRLLDDLPTHPGTMVLRDMRFNHRNGNERLVVMTFTSRGSGTDASIVINLHDVTVERALEERLRFDAMHDPLTGTWNRSAFTEALEKACAVSARDGRTMALLFVDIDHFKLVNDTYGHDRGDELLIHVAQTIQSCLRGSDILGRWGGDEFVVLVNLAQDTNHAIVVANRILAQLDRAARLLPDVNPTTISISIGIATNDGTRSATTLARLADEAMYEAKRGGRGRWALSPLEASSTQGESGPQSAAAI
jgi:diguanylate cyclase (GGDEF)-like protein/PAS domain S-box-containing protein